MTPDARRRLLDQLIANEGLRLKVYRCPAGKLTIGVGRNLEDNGITKDEAVMLLENDISRVERELDQKLPWWRQLSEVRQRVVMDMSFNMGLPSLLGFKQTLAALKRGDYEAAAKGMEDSKWYEQVPVRAARLVAMMRTDLELRPGGDDGV